MANIINAKAYQLVRRDTLANWNSKNPTLRSGEICLVTDAEDFSKMIKICTVDGKRWLECEYYNVLTELPPTDQVYNPTSENAQSGKAVYAAVSGAVKDKMDKFAEVSREDVGDGRTIMHIEPNDEDTSIEIKAYNLNFSATGTVQFPFVEGSSNTIWFNGNGIYGTPKIMGLEDLDEEEDYNENWAINKNYAEKLRRVEREKSDKVYSNALKGKSKAEKALRIDGVSPIEHNLEVKLENKNLIPYPYGVTSWDSSDLRNGITYTVNADGSITANGTLTNIKSSSIIYLTDKTSEAFNLPLNKTYTISGAPAAEGFTISIRYCNRSNGWALDDSSAYNGASKTFTTSTYAPSTAVQITITSNGEQSTINNLVFKPQIELGSVATEYTPHISDFTDVTLTKCGKNLLKYQYYSVNSSNGVTVKDNGDGSLTLNGTSTADLDILLSNVPTDIKPFVPGEVYTASLGVSALPEGVVGFFNAYSGISWLRVSSADLTPSKAFPTDGTGLYFYLHIYSGTKLNNLTLKPQVETGDTATEYEPYIRPCDYAVGDDGWVENVNSVYPTTVLTSNKDGVIINCEYNRDINKAFEELLEKVTEIK